MQRADVTVWVSAFESLPAQIPKFVRGLVRREYSDSNGIEFTEPYGDSITYDRLRPPGTPLFPSCSARGAKLFPSTDMRASLASDARLWRWEGAPPPQRLFRQLQWPRGQWEDRGHPGIPRFYIQAHGSFSGSSASKTVFVTKFGSRAFHDSAYGYHQNDDLNQDAARAVRPRVCSVACSIR